MDYCEICKSVTRHKVEVIHPQVRLLTCTNCGKFGYIESALPQEETFRLVDEYIDRTRGEGDGKSIIGYSPIDPVTGKISLR